MTISQSATLLYDFYLRQVVAESYLEDRNGLGDPLYLQDRIVNHGNNRLPPGPNEFAGFTRLTEAQFDEFNAAYRVVDQTSDNPGDSVTELLFPGGPIANTGFSATLMQSRTNPLEFTLSFRSTESKEPGTTGGDREAPRRFVWNPTVRIDGRRRARWACGQAAFEPVHMSTGRLPGARI